MIDKNKDKNTQKPDLREIVSQNLVKFRKQTDMTQQEVAEKINYSDKAVSKWERGDGVPDVLVLKELADLYGVTVNDFLVVHKNPINVKRMWKNLIAKRWLIALLSAGLVLLVATVITVIWLFVDSTVPVAKYAFLIAVPVALIVLLVFSCIWSKLWLRCVMASLLLWSLCTLIHVLVETENSWMAFIVGAASQLLIVLWYLLRFYVLKDKKRKEVAKNEEQSKSE